MTKSDSHEALARKALDEAAAAFCVDSRTFGDAKLTIRPTKMLLPWPWTEDEAAAAQALVDQTYKESFGRK